MRKQQGFSVLVLLAVLIVGGAVLMGFFKIMPVYSEYYAIKEAIDKMALESSKSEQELRHMFTSSTAVQDIVSVRAQDLIIDATQTRTGIGVRYSREVPLREHVKLVFDFEYQAGSPVLKEK